MIGQIYLNDRGRMQVSDRELTSGDSLKVLIVDVQYSKEKWIDTTVEHNGDSYYLIGIDRYSPIGLFADVQN